MSATPEQSVLPQSSHLLHSRSTFSDLDERERALQALDPSSPTPNPSHSRAMDDSSLNSLPNSRPPRPLSMWSYSSSQSNHTPSNSTIHPSHHSGSPASRHLHPHSGSIPKRSSRWSVIILPPALLPHSPPPAHVSGFAHGYGASGRYSAGILIPLQATVWCFSYHIFTLSPLKLSQPVSKTHPKLFFTAHLATRCHCSRVFASFNRWLDPTSQS